MRVWRPRVSGFGLLHFPCRWKVEGGGVALTGETEGSGGGSVAVQQGAGPGRHPGGGAVCDGNWPFESVQAPSVSAMF